MSQISRTTTLLELAAIISEHLKMQKINSTLVGGTVVSIYSENEYQSKDLDFISPADQRHLVEAMALIGFKKTGKDFYHSETEFTVEFPSGPLALGNEIPVKTTGKGNRFRNDPTSFTDPMCTRSTRMVLSLQRSPMS